MAAEGRKIPQQQLQQRLTWMRRIETEAARIRQMLVNGNCESVSKGSSGLKSSAAIRGSAPARTTRLSELRAVHWYQFSLPSAIYIGAAEAGPKALSSM